MRNYLSLVKFSHTIFALPFAVIGFFIAVQMDGYPFRWTHFLLMLACMVFARSAAMAFNRYLDRHIDRENPRTAIREVPSGVITPRNAALFVVANAALFVLCAGLINRMCLYLSPIALVVILGYSYTKRFTALCHLVLGIGLALAPIGAYLAVTARFDLLPLFFSSAVFCWVAGFDIIYSLQDEEIDRKLALHSIPAKLGKSKALQVSRLLHLLAVCSLITAGISGAFGSWYWMGTIAFTGLLIYQHTLVSPEDLSRVNRAFFTTNGVASVVFAIFVLIDMFT